jgi:hypothetical protein
VGSRLRFNRQVSGIAFVGAFEKQRAMEKPGDAPPFGLVHDRLGAVRLHPFSTLPAAEQQSVEPDETPFVDILDQSVGTEMSAPAPEPFLCDPLRAMACVADIVVARHRAKPHPNSHINSAL